MLYACDMKITRDIRPLTEFKRDSARMIAEMRETGAATVLTVNGKPSVVVMDAAAWQSMRDRLDAADTLIALRDGIEDMEAGRMRPAADINGRNGA
jgi:prevent-host-death family protein